MRNLLPLVLSTLVAPSVPAAEAASFVLFNRMNDHQSPGTVRYGAIVGGEDADKSTVESEVLAPVASDATVEQLVVLINKDIGPDAASYAVSVRRCPPPDYACADSEARCVVTGAGEGVACRSDAPASFARGDLIGMRLDARSTTPPDLGYGGSIRMRAHQPRASLSFAAVRDVDGDVRIPCQGSPQRTGSDPREAASALPRTILVTDLEVWTSATVGGPVQVAVQGCSGTDLSCADVASCTVSGGTRSCSAAGLAGALEGGVDRQCRIRIAGESADGADVGVGFAYEEPDGRFFFSSAVRFPDVGPETESFIHPSGANAGDNHIDTNAYKVVSPAFTITDLTAAFENAPATGSWAVQTRVSGENGLECAVARGDPACRVEGVQTVQLGDVVQFRLEERAGAGDPAGYVIAGMGIVPEPGSAAGGAVALAALSHLRRIRR